MPASRAASHSKPVSRTVYELIAGKTSAYTRQSSGPQGASTL